MHYGRRSRSLLPATSFVVNTSPANHRRSPHGGPAYMSGSTGPYRLRTCYQGKLHPPRVHYVIPTDESVSQAPTVQAAAPSYGDPVRRDPWHR